MAAAESPAEDGTTPVPTTEIDASAGVSVSTDSQVKEDEWQAMQTILKTIYDYRSEDGHDASKIFHKNVNKRNLPDYYEVIKEPMALSVIRKKISLREYKSFEECVRDFTLITYNAQVYNRSNSGAYQDALEIKQVLEEALKKIVDAGTITEEAANLPFIGEIPVQEDPVPEDEEEEEEDEEEEDEEDGNASDDSRKRRGRRGRRKTAEGASKDEETGREGWKKKRGRPPKVDTPMEGRIKNILKGLRRAKLGNGDLKIFSFDRLPDKAAMPDYYVEIKNPMAVDTLKKKLKRKKYQSVDQFMQDVELMFENAKVFNEDNSQIYQDAVFLQQEARNLAADEQSKPDSDFAMEDGRLPLPEGIIHKGELYRVGDWVHLVNPNDLTKPIVTQIYRTWQDGTGQKYVNACWYYRPEQTVHRFDRHFYENEIVKTGQYRDHAVDEIIDRCFVMFITRYSKGRPRGFPTDKEIYVCESRYNEEKHTFNKIKTWASCLPDEVRDKDYEMDMFPVQRKIKKQPSPIAYLLKDEQKETDELSKPEWGADNAPPKIGAVHRRPRNPKDSPPPEPTPTPPPREPTPPPPPPKRVPSVSQPNGASQHSGSNMMMPTPLSTRPPLMNTPLQTIRNMQSQYYRGPAPISPAPLARQTSSVQSGGYSAHTPQTNARSHGSDVQRHQQLNAAYPANSNYKAPHPIEVYHLMESANSSIPPEVRQQFQCDDQGHVLFFTAPPLNMISLEEEQQRSLQGHSVKYLAAKAKRAALISEKRKRDLEAELTEDLRRTKLSKKRQDEFERTSKEDVKTALHLLEAQMSEACSGEYQALYGDSWREELSAVLERLELLRDT